MLDRDPLAVVVKDDLAHQQPHDALTLGERELVQAGAQAGHELIEALGELEIGLGVGHLASIACSWAVIVRSRVRSAGIRSRSSSSVSSCS